MSVKTDVVNLIVNVGGDKAKDELNKLRKTASDLNSEMRGLKKSTDEYKTKAAELGKINDQMATLRKTIGLTALSQKELTAELARLRALKSVATPQTKEFEELQKSINKVTSRLWEVKNGVFGVAAIFKKLKDEIGGFGVAALGALGAEMLMSKMGEIVNGAGKLSDQLADLQRVASMTAIEAKNLNKELTAIDTRTSTGGLREIAIIAGKLGVAKADIFDFTKAVDMLVVSLGDELGNADEITTQLGKILNVFDGKVTGDNITRLGNAFVKLANDGVATGAFMADFDQRLSGVAKSANIGLGELTGMGAGLEQLGEKVESSATALQKLIVKIAGDIPAAAKVAGQSTAEFNKQFSTNPTEAILQYTKGLVANKGAFSELVNSLKDAGEEGSRTVQLISKLGANTDMMRNSILLGAEAVTESTAITSAFALKNETLASTLDKIGKEFSKLFASNAVTNFLSSAAVGLFNFLKALIAMPKWIYDNWNAIKAFTFALIALNSVTLASTIGAWIGQLVLYTAGLKAGTVWTSLLAGATKVLNFAMTGLLAVSAFMVVKIYEQNKAYKEYLSSLDQAVIKLRLKTEVMLKAQEAVGTEIAQAEALVIKLKNLNGSRTEQMTTLNKLKELAKGHLDNLTLENLKTAEGASLLEKYVKALMAKAEAQAKEQLLVDKIKRRDELKLKYGIEDTSTNNLDNFQHNNNVSKGDESMIGGLFNMATGAKSERQKVNDDLKELKSTLNDIDVLGKQIGNNPGINTVLGGGTSSLGTPTSESEQKAAAKAKKEAEALARKNNEKAQREKEAQEKLHDELLQQRDAYLAALKSKDETELEQIEAKFDKLVKEANGNKDNLIQIEANKHLALQVLHKKWTDRFLQDQANYEADVLEEDKKAAKKLLEQKQDQQKRLLEWLSNSIAESQDRLADYNDQKGNFTARNYKKLKGHRGSNDDYEQTKNELSDKEKENEAKIQMAERLAGGLYNIENGFSKLLAKKENKDLRDFEKQNDAKRKSWEDLYNKKKITKQQYDAFIAQSDKELADKKHAIAVKQAKRDKEIAISTALIQAALGIVKIWSEKGVNPVLAGIITAIEVAATGLAIADIVATEVPEAEDGMLIKGARHSEGGVNINAEDGEVILSRKTVANNAELVDALLFNSQNKGGARLQFSPFNNPSISTQNILTGSSNSTATNMASTNNVASSTEMYQLLTALIIEQQKGNQLLGSIPTHFKASVQLQDIKDKQTLLDTIKEESGLHQH